MLSRQCSFQQKQIKKYKKIVVDGVFTDLFASPWGPVSRYVTLLLIIFFFNYLLALKGGPTGIFKNFFYVQKYYAFGHNIHRAWNAVQLPADNDYIPIEKITYILKVE